MKLYKYYTSKEIPTLFLHGFLGSSKSWNEIVKILKKHSITLDITGHNRSLFDQKDTNYSIENWCTELKNQLDKESIQSINLCGYSMGGRLAIGFAQKYPSLIKNLILESTTPGIIGKEDKKIRYNTDLMLCDKIVSDYKKFILDWEQLSLFKHQFKKNKNGFINQRKIRLAHDPLQISKSLKVFSQGKLPDYYSSIPEFSFPIHIITGRFDKKYTSIGKRMDNLCKNSTHHLLDSGHNVHLEEPILYTQIMKKILNSSK